MQLSRASIVARNAFYLFIGQVVSTVLGLLLNAALGRTLGPIEFGIYYLLTSICAFSYVIVDWGQTAVIVREAVRSPHETGDLLGAALIFRLIVAGILALLAAFGTKSLGYSDRVQVLSALAILCGIPLALSQVFGYVFRARNRMDLDTAISVAAKLISVIIAVGALLFGARLAWVFIAQLCGGVGGLGLAVLAWYSSSSLPKIKASWATIRKLIREGGHAAIFFIVVAVQPLIEAIVLSKMSTPEIVGFYGAARNIIGVLMAPANILTAAAFPELSRAAASTGELSRVLRKALKPMLMLGSFGGLGCLLFSHEAVAILYSRSSFGPSVDVLKVFAPALFIVYFEALFGAVAFATGHTRSLALVKLLNVLLSTALSFILVPLAQHRFENGGLGIVAAFTGGELVMLLGYAVVLPQGLFTKETLHDAMRALLSALIAFVGFALIPAIPTWAGIPLCFVMYMFGAIITGLITRNEIRMLVAHALELRRSRRGQVSQLNVP